MFAGQVEEAVEGNPEFAAELATAEDAGDAGDNRSKKCRWRSGIRSALSSQSGGLFAKLAGTKSAAGRAVYRVDAAAGGAAIAAWNASCAEHPGRQPLPGVLRA